MSNGERKWIMTKTMIHNNGARPTTTIVVFPNDDDARGHYLGQKEEYRGRGFWINENSTRHGGYFIAHSYELDVKVELISAEYNTIYKLEV